MRFIPYKNSILYPKDIKRLRQFLDTKGYLEATDAELDDLWRDFSDEKYSASFLSVPKDDGDERFEDFIDFMYEKLEIYD